ncbi:MAG: FadR family transcriptional regulator [Rhodobacteraceae bacterium]|nr:FadR family transcriptional regulator [Paracoccaceae bacterium]
MTSQLSISSPHGAVGENELSVPLKVARWVQNHIETEQLGPGDALPSQRDICALLSVSRPSVREGVSMLETLGLIRVEQRRGLFVAEPERRRPMDYWPNNEGYSLHDVYQFRAKFEPAALALAYGNMDDGVVARLRLSAEALTEAAQKGDAVAAAEQDTLFHDLIFESCGNELYKDMRQHMAKLIQDSQWVPMVIIECVADTAREHGQIVAAILDKDCSAACAALEAHIISAARRCDIDLKL